MIADPELKKHAIETALKIHEIYTTETHEIDENFHDTVEKIYSFLMKP